MSWSSRLRTLATLLGSASAGDIYKVGRQPGFPDDFAHAVNYGCCALWNAHDAWPDLAALTGHAVRILTQEQYEAIVGEENAVDDLFSPHSW